MIVFAFGGRKPGLSAGAIDALLKVGLYFLHERIWGSVRVYYGGAQFSLRLNRARQSLLPRHPLFARKEARTHLDHARQQREERRWRPRQAIAHPIAAARHFRGNLR